MKLSSKPLEQIASYRKPKVEEHVLMVIKKIHMKKIHLNQNKLVNKI